MKSIRCGCDFCNDMRNIQPAKHIGGGGGDEEFQQWIKKAREAKHFILVSYDDYFYIVNRCPVCGYEFTEEDYNNYD